MAESSRFVITKRWSSHNSTTFASPTGGSTRAADPGRRSWAFYRSWSSN